MFFKTKKITYMIIFKGNSKRANFEKLGVPGPGAYF
jgi:hypothetical protein